MTSAWFSRSSVLPAVLLLAVACHDATTADKSGGGSTQTGTPPYATVTIDGPIPYDAGPIWGGLNLFQGSDGSTSIISMDYADNRLRFASCHAGCDSATAWKTLTVDSGGADYFNSGAAMGTGGLYAVYQQSGQGIRYAHCASGCDNAANWQTSTLFGGFIGTNGPHVNPLAVDAGGNLHLVYMKATGGFTYATCASACGSGASWTTTQLDSLGYRWSIAAEPSGKLDLVYVSFGGLTYATCDSACTTGSNWTKTVIDAAGARSEAMTYAGGALHLAYADSINAVHYATCSTSCSTPASWQHTLIGQTSPNDVAIAVGGGRISIATSQNQIVVSSCMSACTSSAAWPSVSVDSARAAGGGYLSLAIDGAGLPRLASTVNWLQFTQITQ